MFDGKGNLAFREGNELMFFIIKNLSSILITYRSTAKVFDF